MVLFMFFEALYFGHFLSFYTMQLEPPKKWEVAEGNCCCTTSPFSLSQLRAKTAEGRSAAEEPHQPRCIIQVLGWKIIHCPLTVLQASKLEDSAPSLLERRPEPWVA